MAQKKEPGQSEGREIVFELFWSPWRRKQCLLVQHAFPPSAPIADKLKMHFSSPLLHLCSREEDGQRERTFSLARNSYPASFVLQSV